MIIKHFYLSIKKNLEIRFGMKYLHVTRALQSFLQFRKINVFVISFQNKLIEYGKKLLSRLKVIRETF